MPPLDLNDSGDPAPRSLGRLHEPVGSEPRRRAEAQATLVETNVPARLDALPWSRFHSLVVVALGVTWILDGLEVTLAGAVAGVLTQSVGLGLTASEVGLAGAAYLCGAVLGALAFGWMTDRLGRRKLFFITLAVYLAGTAATGVAWSGGSYTLFRFIVGCGIGGEYAAVNSAIQELIPARLRGWTDLVINGSFWLGAAVGAGASIFLLNPAVIQPWLGWRLAFMIGAALGLLILLLRRWIPESPRWLMLHGHASEAEEIVGQIESQSSRRLSPEELDRLPRIKLRNRGFTPLTEIYRAMFRLYPRRTMVGLALMASQAFLYNSVFFTYALVLTDFYGLDATQLGWHLLALAAGNFLGPLLLGRLFDTLGRRIMITATYVISGLLLLGVGYLFQKGLLTAEQQTIGWMAVFFFASAAASSAYLTVSETFPLEIRAMAIAVFYALGTLLGGAVSPWLLGTLIGTGNRARVFEGYALGAGLMIAAGLIEWAWGIAAERKALEAVCRPLGAVDD
ncbi:MFS transporter [Methylocystis bryophila]|uniref:MFS transporter n=1 Tax=Methylocystis bryophila TaxID=655015 RepID=UPI000A27034C|nr:MFS transporter [Methylocystis bryophila]BDV37175.1 MFS transporter [Methylocystis bryophila]